MSFNLLLKDVVIEYIGEHEHCMSVEELPLGLPGYAYEYVTLKSCYNTTLFEIFRWFRSILTICNSENGENCIVEMIKVYQQSKDLLSGPLKEYILVDGILEACYRLQIEDSLLACQILNLFYDTWSSFGNLHFRAILGRRDLYRTSPKNSKKSKKPDFLAYFLEHARRSKLTYNGTRMIDVSLYSRLRKAAVFVAAEIWCWKPLLRYLQYGARFENVPMDTAMTRHGVELAIVDTLRTLVRHLWLRLVSPASKLLFQEEIQEFCESLTSDVQDLCKTVKIILRAVKCVRLENVEFTILDFENEWVMEIPSKNVLTHPITDFMIPTLSKRYACPVELKHCCRWTIRKRLNENWQLPCGIKSLPIPNKLRRYLNLLSG